VEAYYCAFLNPAIEGDVSLTPQSFCCEWRTFTCWKGPRTI